MDEMYKAYKVDAKETQAMGIFQLAYNDTVLKKFCEDEFAFNILEFPLSKAYRVQTGRIENGNFISYGESTSIPIPEERSLEQIAKDELRFTKLKTNIFLNNRLYLRYKE